MGKKYFLIFFSVLILSCSQEKGPTIPYESSAFAIYFLRDDSTMAFYEIEKQPLNDLALQPAAWISADDIACYDFSAHLIYLKEDKDKFFRDFTAHGFYFDFLIKPFVLVASQQRIYLGGLLNSFATSSLMPCFIHIDNSQLQIYPKDIIPISTGYNLNGSSADVRSDERIKNALIEANLYHAGLGVQLNSIDIIENADTSTVRYTFTVVNNDADVLYVPDPALMGNEIFHYFTNSIVLYNDSTIYFAAYHAPAGVSWNSWSPTWFTRLYHQSYMQRTVTQKGYPKFKKGTYHCSFEFSGPKVIQKEQRQVADGRYWIGEIKSNQIEIQVR